MYRTGLLTTALFAVAVALLAAFFRTAPDAAQPVTPPPARIDNVTDTYFGVTVVDPYRWMEAPGNTELDRYLRVQNGHTRRMLDRIPARPHLKERIRALQSGTARVRFVHQAGGYFYFLETSPEHEAARVMQRAVAGGQKRVLVDPASFDTGERKASIDFIKASHDGRHLAFAVSHAGAEDWSLRVVDTESGKLLDDVVPRIAMPIPSWAADGSGFYYSRLQDLPEDAPESQRYENVRAYFHALGAKTDEAVFGAGVIDGIDIPEAMAFPDVIATPGGRYLLATLVRGTDYNSRAVWVRELDDETPRWRKIIDHADGVGAMQVFGDGLYVISSANAPNGRVLRFDPSRETFAGAEVVLPESDVIISADNGLLGAAKDAIYLLGQRDGYAVVRRLPAGNGKVEDLDLPGEGVMFEFSVDHRVDGACFELQSPVRSPQFFCYRPGKSIANTGLMTADPADYGNVEVRRAYATSADGTEVPLTVVTPKNIELDGRNPVLLTVYGAYGAIVPMWFVAPNLAWHELGGIAVFAHTRGGGEKGAAWHEAARTTRKQKTIDDTLAAARWLIDHGYTSPQRLAIAGKSAGGIPAGGVIVQRPDLFRAALIRVGATDLLRIEQTRTGPANVEEFGSVANEEEFHALHAISPYANVRDGVAYPAVMLEAGANDPRIPPWQLAKMAARLQAASTSGLPVLLRVDFAAGHGLGNDKEQVAELLADEYAFLGWQFGLPGFEPSP